MNDARVDEQPVILVEGLVKSYGETPVLAGVDLEVRRGEVVALLGPNGAGKTTTIEILEGSRQRDGGHVSILGFDPAQVNDEWRSRVGVVMQSWRDHARWCPQDLIGHIASLHRPYVEASGRRMRSVSEILDLVGLSGQAEQRIRTLSGGQRRRLDVAIGIVGRPELLFLDEPTAGLDPQGRREFHELIHALVDDDNTTVLLTTHDLDEAGKLADRILILAGGRIVANGSEDDLAASIAHEAQVRWSANGVAHVHATPNPTTVVRSLLTGPDGDVVTDLLVSRASLEDTYIELVTRHEAGLGPSSVFKEAS
jgi:ABC-2 type transport system ATP-binding protein